MNALMQCFFLGLVCLATLAEAKGFSPTKATAHSWVDTNRQQLVDVNQAIWGLAELGLQETQSSERLATWLSTNGFDVKTGVADMPTAFVAEYGSGKPVIGILAEFDALPGLSQQAVPFRSAREVEGAGHGCGHSLFGTASSAAAIAIRNAMETHKLKGTVRLYGTPAEETLIGKVYMTKAGLFDDVDAVLGWHPSSKTKTGYSTSLAMVSLKFIFSGVSAHAAAYPEHGKSALDAVELMNVGVNYMREHIKDDARIHYVITDGGGAPNVVPAKTEVWYYIRALAHKDVEKYYRWVVDIADGAAQMTRTTVEHRLDTDTHEVLPNRALAELVHANLTLVGPPNFDSEDSAFAGKLQKAFSKESAFEFERELEKEVLPLPDEPEQGSASTDTGEISWKVPTAGFQVASYPSGVPIHTWAVVASAGSSLGQKAMMVAAKTLAGTGIDLLMSPQYIETARAEFQNRIKGIEFVSLLPVDQKPPLSIR